MDSVTAVPARNCSRPPLMVVGVVAGTEGSPHTVRRRSKHAARLNMGASTDDIHVCIMCMRAIMNNKVLRLYYLKKIMTNIPGLRIM